MLQIKYIYEKKKILTSKTLIIKVMRLFFNGFKNAINGIFIAISTQRNMRIHAFLIIAVIVLGFIFEISQAKWIAITFACGLVITAEIINTSIEFLVDFITEERNEKAGRIKDLSAGAVLVSAICAAIIGLVVFVPELLKL